MLEDQASVGVMDGLWQFLQEKSDAELQDESGMDSAILAEIEMLKRKWETAALQKKKRTAPALRGLICK